MLTQTPTIHHPLTCGMPLLMHENHDAAVVTVDNRSAAQQTFSVSAR